MTTRLLTTPRGDTIDVTRLAPALSSRSTYFASLFGGAFVEATKIESGESLCINIPTLHDCDRRCWDEFLRLVAGVGGGDHLAVLYFWQALCYVDVDRCHVEALCAALLTEIRPLRVNREFGPIGSAIAAYSVLLLCDILAIDDGHPYAPLLPLPNDNPSLTDQCDVVGAWVGWPALQEAADAIQNERSRGRLPVPCGGPPSIYHTAVLVHGSVHRSGRNACCRQRFVDTGELPSVLIARTKSGAGPPPPEAPLVVGLDKFRRRLEKRYPVFGPFVASVVMSGRRVILAGGALTSCLDARAPNTPCGVADDVPASDIDMWIYGNDVGDRARTLAWLATEIFDRYRGRVEAVVDGAVVTFEEIAGVTAERLQVIVTSKASAVDVVDQFDQSHVHGYYDGDAIAISWHMLWTLASRRTEPIGARCTCRNVKRTRKANRKGFTVVCAHPSRRAGATCSLQSWRRDMGFAAVAVDGYGSRNETDNGHDGESTNNHLYNRDGECFRTYRARCAVGVLVLASIDDAVDATDGYVRLRWDREDAVVQGDICPSAQCCEGPKVCTPQTPATANAAGTLTLRRCEALVAEPQRDRRIAWIVQFGDGHMVAGGHRGERATKTAGGTSWTHLSARNQKDAQRFCCALGLV
ncbi:hypothetical protein psal_cds_9 [Pandoravirus salinus]|uniref:Uncharacterized protein n=1 Tax=Pandoravirus salinus TaxID=1349410 RepID=S4VST5_9VIRU|nr:hypothetical protein psal_cds_9 [Pandoravirus salinus]AGO83368.1 hypothetical protein psal_cds_9 [Pandoravirus salinus]